MQLYDFGTRFELTITDNAVPVNISTITFQEIIFKKPSGTIERFNSTFTTNGSDGKIEISSVTMDEVGTWEWQGRIEFPSGSKFYTEVKTFVVNESLVE